MHMYIPEKTTMELYCIRIRLGWVGLGHLGALAVCIRTYQGTMWSRWWLVVVLSDHASVMVIEVRAGRSLHLARLNTALQSTDPKKRTVRCLE
ncbi:hypothetical protein BDV36DRAFT_252150 [Aspergillus pseudocaelatus]|uniref:Uncharacterized protein n=1 Tax=Aspergillus pseudocaelatus TaxID=1825620 RepID=A0ABQ6WQ45_9EURO|nr:hypothetical protein BDV36DRAFT_252150 [Aspergillus pseudocaelatus]